MIACVGLPKIQRDWFFDEDYYDKAKEICRGCPAKQHCLKVIKEDEGKHRERHGVWGETTPEERDELWGSFELQEVRGYSGDSEGDVPQMLAELPPPTDGVRAVGDAVPAD